jgi:hypothetical protein
MASSGCNMKGKTFNYPYLSTQNYWGFGLFPSSGILGDVGHDVSETGSLSVFLSHLKTETDPVSEKSKTPVILCVIHHHQNPLESTYSCRYTYWTSVFFYGLYSPIGPWPLIFCFMIILQTIGLLGRVISASLHRGQHKHRINTFTYQTSMPYVGFEPTIPASERVKTVYALDLSATVTG